MLLPYSSVKLFVEKLNEERKRQTFIFTFNFFFPLTLARSIIELSWFLLNEKKANEVEKNSCSMKCFYLLLSSKIIAVHIKIVVWEGGVMVGNKLLFLEVDIYRFYFITCECKHKKKVFLSPHRNL